MNHVIYQTQKGVLDHISKHWEETLVEYIFWRTLRCLEMWPDTVQSLWDIQQELFLQNFFWQIVEEKHQNYNPQKSSATL